LKTFSLQRDFGNPLALFWARDLARHRTAWHAYSPSACPNLFRNANENCQGNAKDRAPAPEQPADNARHNEPENAAPCCAHCFALLKDDGKILDSSCTIEHYNSFAAIKLGKKVRTRITPAVEAI
jgi:hypothetical protein